MSCSDYCLINIFKNVKHVPEITIFLNNARWRLLCSTWLSVGSKSKLAAIKNLGHWSNFHSGTFIEGDIIFPNHILFCFPLTAPFV